MNIERGNEVQLGESDLFAEPVYSRGRTVYVRRYRPKDIDDAYAMVDNDRQRFRRNGVGAGLLYTSKKLMLIDYVESKNPEKVNLGVWNSSDTYVAHVQFFLSHRTPGEGSFDYYMGEAFEGNGYMTAAVETVTNLAFTQMGITRVRGMVFNYNPKSAAVFERLGFRANPLEINATRFFLDRPDARPNERTS